MPKNKRAPKVPPNSFALLLLVLPVVEFIWIFVGGVATPANQVAFFKAAALAASTSFAIVWAISFWKVPRDRHLVAISAFLFFLWMIPGIFTYAKLNAFFDKEPSQEFMSKVSKTHQSIGPKASHTCSVTLEQEVAGSRNVEVKRSYCDGIRPGIDGIKLQLHPGFFGLPWIKDVSIVLDYDLYRQRLGL